MRLFVNAVEAIAFLRTLGVRNGEIAVLTVAFRAIGVHLYRLSDVLVYIHNLLTPQPSHPYSAQD